MKGESLRQGANERNVKRITRPTSAPLRPPRISSSEGAVPRTTRRHWQTARSRGEVHETQRSCFVGATCSGRAEGIGTAIRYGGGTRETCRNILMNHVLRHRPTYARASAFMYGIAVAFGGVACFPFASKGAADKSTSPQALPAAIDVRALPVLTTESTTKAWKEITGAPSSPIARWRLAALIHACHLDRIWRFSAPSILGRSPFHEQANHKGRGRRKGSAFFCHVQF